jgi:exonuclease VII small subunit
MTKTKEKDSISESLSHLESIIKWFDEQSEVQVEEGLKKVKEGAVVIKDLRGRLKEVENEFIELKKELASDE